MNYILPDGFRWVSQYPEYMEFEHIASEKIGAISHCERAVTPDAELQGVLDYSCAKLLREVARDEEHRARLKNFQVIK